MAEITLKGNKIHTSGELPEQGATAPAFELVRTDLAVVTLADYAGKKKILNIFPSVDTGICAMSVRKFHEKAGSMDGVVVLNISADLPFAHKRFCGSEGIENAVGLSTFRSSFAKDYGLEITDGGMRGLCSRAVLVLDTFNRVIHREQVPEIAQEPDYDKALAIVQS
jgi:thiol peroxidase